MCVCGGGKDMEERKKENRKESKDEGRKVGLNRNAIKHNPPHGKGKQFLSPTEILYSSGA